MIDFPDPSKGATPERRTSQRIKFEENIQVINASLEDGSAYSYMLKAANLSERGMMLLSPKQLKFGSKAMISFRLPGQTGQRIACEVKVIWSIISEKAGFFNTGVQFLNLEHEKQVAIKSFMYGRTHANDGAEPQQK